jgi:hypothetical protein
VGHFPFKYRDVYSPTNRDEDIRGVLGLNNIDTDWGIWGHNISLTLPDEPDRNVFAYYEGQRVSSQFCFSSDKLYRYICDYIIDNCGDGKDVPYNFAILPNDNNIACMCGHCQGAGNSEGNSTPAVTKMIRKLATRFPSHTFFTSAYHTTDKPCKHALPENAGVIVSAIDWQPGKELKGKTLFEQKIGEWSKKTNNIYVWDYINNYDDYLTPYPILKSMQRRFKIYRDNGIKGIFLNGSGYDYSTFEDMHTQLLASLMMNPDINIERSVKDYFCRNYPVTGAVISDYYCSLLRNEESTDKVIPIYGGIDEKIDVFLEPNSFVEFYDTITVLKNRAEEDNAARFYAVGLRNRRWLTDFKGISENRLRALALKGGRAHHKARFGQRLGNVQRGGYARLLFKIVVRIGGARRILSLLCDRHALRLRLLDALPLCLIQNSLPIQLSALLGGARRAVRG